MYRYCWRTQYPWRSWRESVSRVLALNNPAPQEFVAVNSFGESGTPAQLMDKYKLNNEAIVLQLKKLLQENNSISIKKRAVNF
jgi:pyruvate dehydrogenase complex dehydrogenase (E1) component